VPFSQLVAKQQDPVLPDHNFDLNTPTESPEFPSSYIKQHRRQEKTLNDPVHKVFRLDPLGIGVFDFSGLETWYAVLHIFLERHTSDLSILWGWRI